MDGRVESYGIDVLGLSLSASCNRVFWFIVTWNCQALLRNLDKSGSAAPRKIRTYDAIILPLWKTYKLLGSAGCNRPYHGAPSDKFGHNRQIRNDITANDRRAEDGVGV